MGKGLPFSKALSVRPNLQYAAVAQKEEEMCRFQLSRFFVFGPLV